MDNSNNKHWKNVTYAGVYDRVGEFALKEELDRQVFEQVLRYIPRKGILVDIACGPAHISKAISELGYRVYGFDISKDMFGKIDSRMHYDFFRGNLVNLDQGLIYQIESKDLLADVGIVVNGWYAMTAQERKKDKNKMEKIRWKSLLNMSKLLKKNGILIITDPLSSSRKLSLLNVISFIKREINAEIQTRLGGKITILKKIKASFVVLLRVLNKKSAKILQYNRQILKDSHLFESAEEMCSFIKRTRIFQVIETNDKLYLGHNILLVARKTVE
jgi:SAM-dependent methyltransferase